ncbi:alpha/beta fold hydrolase [Microbacterium sp.]|uniref:alpha/beta fold hydrolase n=2 Tax=unclassified Microbacterium TaxID=2609290 RepID=UPI0025E9CEEC|nr:alpha/beta fold hydrolase [Microbacterium sp.]
MLIHGIGMSHRSFAGLHRLLAAEGPVYSVDLPGFGGLPKPSADMDVATAARVLGELLADARFGPAVLVGHSMGAQWAIEVATRRPELVSRVVVIGAVTDAARRSFFAQLGSLALDTFCEPPCVNAVAFADYARCGPRWYARQLRHMLRYPIEDRVRALPMPVLVMRGSRDPIAGLRWCRRLRDLAPAAELILVPGHHHAVQHSAPRTVASALRAFVRT